MKTLSFIAKYGNTVLLFLVLVLLLQTCSAKRATVQASERIEVLIAKTDSLNATLKNVSSQLTDQKQILKDEFEFINALSQDQRNMSNKSLNSLLTVLAQKNKAENEKK